MKALRRSASALLMACMLLALPAQACRCPAQTGTAVFYRYADAVARVQVDSVQMGPGPAEALATVTVAQAWKRDLPRQLQVHTETSCAYTFTAGRDELLFLTHDKAHDRWETRRCSGNDAWATSTDRQRWLARRGKPAAVRP